MPLGVVLATFIRSLKVGLSRRWKRGLVSALAYVGGVWLITEVVMAALPQFVAYIESKQVEYLIAMAVVGGIGFFSSIYEPASVQITIPTTDTTLRVLFGDLFDQRDDDLLINANIYFDSQLGQVVSAQSVYGGFIERHYASDGPRLRRDLDAALAGRQGTTTARAILPNVSYAVGTTIELPLGASRAFIFAFATTDLTAAAKASSTIPDLWTSLSDALRYAAHNGNGRPLAVPLVGNGRSGLNLKPQDLLRLIVLCIIVASRNHALPKQLTIVVPEECFEKLDLLEIKRDWQS